MTTILISGGTGLVGEHLIRKFTEKGYNVGVLSRKSISGPGFRSYRWDPDRYEIESGAIESADYIIHLAGANIGDKRWSKKQKGIIIDSRVKSANLLYDKIKESNHHLRAFISASAIGYYGSIPSDKIFRESDPSGNDFLARACQKWEDAVDSFRESGIRTVKIRAGVVLTKRGGALEKMILPVKMGIGSPLGSGKQFMPWIHIEDLSEIYLKAVEDIQMSGAYNAVAPDDKTNADFMCLVAKILKRPFWFPKVPSFMLKLILGQRAVILLNGNKISPDKIRESGFKFKFNKLEDALKDLLD